VRLRFHPGLVLLVGAVSACTCGGGLNTSRGHLEVSPEVVDLGEVAVGSASTRSVRLSNTGRGALSITGVSLEGSAPFSWSDMPTQLGSTASASFKVTYRAGLAPRSDAAILVLTLEGADVIQLRVPLLAMTVAGMVDAGADAGIDAGVDGGSTDSGVDAGFDAGVDAGFDAGVDAGFDAGVDAGLDAGVDAGFDAGMPCADGGFGCHPASVRVYNGYACARLQDERVFCWGLVPDSCCTAPYWRSQDVTEIALPLPAGGRRNLEGGGDTMCVRRENGPVACWGGGIRPAAQLTSITGLDRNVERVVGSSTYLCTIRTDAGVDCWGAGVRINDGAGPDAFPFPDVMTPTTVTGFGPADEVAAGFTHICGRAGSSLKCWGYNSSGLNCPMGASPGVRLPGIVQPIARFDAGVASVQVHDRGTCVVDGAGEVWCWGSNLGPGSPGQVFSGCTPTRIVGLDTPVRSLCSGGQHQCALQGNGTVRCWGESYGRGLLGSDGGSSSVPNLVPGITNAVELSCGSVHSCVRTADGRVLCWGSNEATSAWGALGIADAGLPFSSTPVRVPLPR
jgi:hypothetical protein